MKSTSSAAGSYGGGRRLCQALLAALDVGLRGSVFRNQTQDAGEGSLRPFHPPGVNTLATVSAGYAINSVSGGKDFADGLTMPVPWLNTNMGIVPVGSAE